MKKIIQTAGRNALTDFSPEFAHFNDDILFGENWNNQDIDLKTRSIITVVALMSSGITDASLIYHLQNAKAHGVTQGNCSNYHSRCFLCQVAKRSEQFSSAKEVWQPEEGDLPYEDAAMRAHAKSMFSIGQPNDAFCRIFCRTKLSGSDIHRSDGIFDVTFEPGCRNNWHIHHAKRRRTDFSMCCRTWILSGGSKSGRMKPGDCINIPAEVKHWHGAAPDEWFSIWQLRYRG